MIGVGGGASGALLVARGERVLPERAPSASEDPGATSSAIERLTAEMRAFRTAIELRLSEPSPPGEMRAPATDASAERLERAVVKLTEVLENSRAGLVPPSPASRVEHESIRPKQIALLEQLRRISVEERNQEYRFWSLQEVLDQFGKPDGFWPDPDHRWHLQYTVEGGSLQFRFVNGMLFMIED